jgi:hypothetical protein
VAFIASIFDAMLPRSAATCAAARALRFHADELERRIEVAESQTAAKASRDICRSESASEPTQVMTVE